jgi:GcrA cell cycle regulator
MTYYGNGKSDWPTEMVEHLKICHAKGMTDFELTQDRVFRGFSRNAIIGRRNRLGLKANRPTTPEAIRRSKLNPHQRRNKQPKTKVQLFDGWKAPRQSPSKPRTAGFAGPVVLPPTEPGELPTVFPPLPLVPIGIAELEDASCRWPTHGTGATMLYCGATKTDDKLSFCRFHCRLAYRPRA